MKYRHHKFWRLIVWLTIYGLVCPPSFVFAATEDRTRDDASLNFQKSQAAQQRRDAIAKEEAAIAAEKAKINESNRLKREENARRNREIQEAHDAAIKAAQESASNLYSETITAMSEEISAEAEKDSLVASLYNNGPIRPAGGSALFPKFGGGIKNISADTQYLTAFKGYLGELRPIATSFENAAGSRFLSFDMKGIVDAVKPEQKLYNVVVAADGTNNGELNEDPAKDALTQIAAVSVSNQVVSKTPSDDPAAEAKNIARAHVTAVTQSSNQLDALLAQARERTNPTPTTPGSPPVGHTGVVDEAFFDTLTDNEKKAIAGGMVREGAKKYTKNINTVNKVLTKGLAGLQKSQKELDRAAELKQKGPSLIDPNEGTTDPSVADAGRGAAGGGSPSDSGAGDSGAGSGGGGGGSGDGGGGNNDGGGNLEAAKVPGPGEIPKSPDFSGLRQPESDINPVAQGIQGLQGEQTALSTFNSPVTPLQVQRIQKRTVPNTGNQQFASNTRLRPGFPFPGGSSSVGSALSNNFFGNGAVPLSGEIARGAGGGGGGGGGGSGFTGNPFNVGADFGGRPPKLNAVKTVAYGSGGGANGSDDGGSSIATGAAGFSPQLQRQLLGGRAFKDPPEKGKLGLLSRVGTLLSDLCDDSTQKDITGVCGNAEEVRQKAVAREISGTPSRAIASVPEEAQGLVKEGVVTQ